MPEDTPYYPGAHYLGSRDWTSEEREGATMGEWEGEQIWDKGEPPLVRPEIRLVGAPECIERGGGGDVPTQNFLGLDNWLPANCYVIDGDHPRIRIVKCPDVARIAEIMAYVFIDHVHAESLAETFVGDGSTAMWHLGAGDESVSTSITCKRGTECWQFCDGTRNAGQLLSQAFGSVAGPISYGQYATTPIYQHYATEILSRFTAAGAENCRRFVLVGHSYGGAAAAVAAARLISQDNTRTVALYTLGAPRAGDSRLIDLLRRCDQTHIRRPSDPIPYLPPPVGVWRDLIYAVAAGGLVPAFAQYETFDNRRLVDGEGFRDELPTDGPSNTDMVTILENLLAHDDLGFFSEHFLSRYANDLATNCGLPPPFDLGLG